MKDENLLRAGFIAPIIVLVSVFTSSLFYPGYSHISDMMSFLGSAQSPAASFMNIFGFIFAGVLISAFGLGVWKTRTGLFGKLSSIFFIIGGIGWSMIGIFPVGPTPFMAVTHSIAVGVFLWPMIFGFILLWVNTRKEKSMRFYLIAFIAVILVNSYASGIRVVGVNDGLVQRISVGAMLLLLMYTSRRLSSISKPTN